MTTLKTFTKGTAFPPLEKGKLRLYSMRFCPYAQRTRLVLSHKKIPHETVNVDLKEKPEWFIERNPLGLVPTLEQDDHIVYESLITCDYLDDLYPSDRLTPADPYKQARDRMLVDFFGNKFVPNYYKALRSKGEDQEAVEALKKALQRLEDELGVSGKFFGGEKIAMIDYMMWPWFERLVVLAETVPAVNWSETSFPRTYGWTKSMLADPAVKETFFDKETHVKFMASYLEGKPNYDIGLDP